MAIGCRHNVAAALRYILAIIRRGLGDYTKGPGERVLSGFCPNARIALIAAGVAALGLYGCGRAGPLELPPGPATPTASTQLTQPDGSPAPGSPGDTAMKNGFDAQGNPVATPGQKKPFILDPILQ
jgi:predicted small lipoprotein YifL